MVLSGGGLPCVRRGRPPLRMGYASSHGARTECRDSCMRQGYAPQIYALNCCTVQDSSIAPGPRAVLVFTGGGLRRGRATRVRSAADPNTAGRARRSRTAGYSDAPAPPGPLAAPATAPPCDGAARCDGRGRLGEQGPNRVERYGGRALKEHNGQDDHVSVPKWSLVG